MFMQPRNQAAVKVLNFIIVESGTYQEQYRRPYVTETTPSVMAGLVSALQDNYSFNNVTSHTVDSDAMMGVSNMFLKPSAAIESAINISYGWNNPRGRFMMLVCIGTDLDETYHLLTGYASVPDGITTSGHVDPRMEFIVNSVVNLRRVVYNTPTGPVENYIVAESSQILMANNYAGIAANPDMLCRPSDIITTFGLVGMPSQLGASIFDSRTMLRDKPVKSSRNNNVASSYVGNVFSSYATAYQENNTFGADEDSINKFARRNASDSTVAVDRFLSAISGIRSVSGTNSFTMQELNTLDPNAMPTVAISGGVQQTSINPMLNDQHQTGMTKGWQDNDRQTVVATMIANTIPAYVAEAAALLFHFRANNMTMMDGSHTVTMMDSRSFIPMDMTSAITAFRSKLIMGLLADISFNGQMAYEIEVRCNLVGDTYIKVGLNGEYPIEYVVPTFADSMLAPIITSDHTRSISIASDFKSVIGTVFGQNDTGFGAPVTHYST